MTKRTKTVAVYKTKAGAERYAKDLFLKFFPQKIRRAYPTPIGFGWGVCIATADGRLALAATRPHNFGK